VRFHVRYDLENLILSVRIIEARDLPVRANALAVLCVYVCVCVFVDVC